ncbi:indolepyruvate ferredoxin oxidoreductase subunit alpha [Abyssisolibacter fermentans]|uniref:indolepyruvate ferredoxin oxidoreductase subunit alpha n=1 Tax=Abyssisolibacter fermentans TaxID=1766203 RepID=UPI0008367929|nr:indolepyruvate ferredoxin oxidoreductase subunit alpha [Abyssisolibacter fermentans]
MKKLMTGNEAIARGVYEAGITFAAAYPGTPSTEILENVALYKDDIVAEWAPNEKVAFESALGASIAGARTFASMKQVGVNVAADPMFSFSYTGVNGGFVMVSADEPGIHSSQTEQDNRYYAKFAKLAMLEPSDSGEAKEMVKEAVKISEEFDTIALIRMTTRVCHSKSIVELNERCNVPLKNYTKNINKYATMPAISMKLRVKVEDRMKKLEKFSNETPLNYIEWNDKKIGVISSGVAYQYAKEVFGDTVSYLKLGFTYPLPMDKIKSFADEVDTLYVIEELEPFIEEQIKANGIDCIGKDKIPNVGELNPHIIRKNILDKENDSLDTDANKLIPRPPTLCAGCPHRGVFYELGKRKNIMVTGDIGCYGLGALPPLSSVDTIICMGASVSAGHGAAKVYRNNNSDKKVVSVIGDSTFFHSGMTGLLDVAYNQSNTVTIILDNRITGMTGHQDHPGTGITAQGQETLEADIEVIVKALGIRNVKTINPLRLNEMKEALDWALDLNEPSVIITRWPCALKRRTEKEKNEFGSRFDICKVNESICIGCKKCLSTGCPALSFNLEDKKAVINENMCLGCEICSQVCPVNAIDTIK